jgi:hypothetical protein
VDDDDEWCPDVSWDEPEAIEHWLVTSTWAEWYGGMTSDWEAFDAETATQLELWRAYLGLWKLEVISTRCAWQLWPTDATRAAYVRAMAEREKCEAAVDTLTQERTGVLAQ